MSESGWQSMDTAPKDGTPVLLWNPDYYQGKGGHSVGLWHQDGWYSLALWKQDPKFWMPLPDPPVD